MEIRDRRYAIAQMASLEQLTARLLQEQAESPPMQAAAEWVEARLSEIEPFLVHADSMPVAWREQWLNTAERWLMFYVSELRRLQDLCDVPDRSSPETRH